MLVVFLYSRALLKELQLEDEEQLLAAVQEVDHVRPKWATVVWMRKLMARVGDPKARQALQAAWSKALTGFLSLNFAAFGLTPDPRFLRILEKLGRGGPSLLEDPTVQTMLAETDDGYIKAAQGEIERCAGTVNSW